MAQAQRTRQLMDRVCAVNNANVTRDYGTHTEDLTHAGMVPPDLSSDELADAKRLLGIVAVDRASVKPPRCSTPPEITAPESTP